MTNLSVLNRSVRNYESAFYLQDAMHCTAYQSETKRLQVLKRALAYISHVQQFGIPPA